MDFGLGWYFAYYKTTLVNFVVLGVLIQAGFALVGWIFYGFGICHFDLVYLFGS